MIMEGQTELLDAIEEARARLALALSTGSAEAPDLAAELGRLERIVTLLLLGRAPFLAPGNGNRPSGSLWRFAGSNTRSGQPFLLPGKARVLPRRDDG